MSLDNVSAMVTTHVDDLALASSQDWLDRHYDLFLGKFKKVTRQQLPFAHVRATMLTRQLASPSARSSLWKR